MSDPLQASAESIAAWLHSLGFTEARLEYRPPFTGEVSDPHWEILCDDGPHCWPLMVNRAMDRGEVTLVDADLHVVNGTKARVLPGEGRAPISIGREMEEGFWEDVDRRQQQDAPPGRD